ncbi:uncharacterized protein BDR25DRAFT_361858 [Lindgomyces ingoldianus]|uniref:Uncharacterized protein n=1 Tax=Lindgomyces ingoldianus TaxID=673940 RepID=A0ACB6QCM6_9PLEO|nr:uncharacterized protein BDR25DRAFT_361858 [Lindgomyces ingoldianus]KAF2464363.1 hypothetical protein BDR25DRAFT_361858 [Lindgomyces ingoldianus]
MIDDATPLSLRTRLLGRADKPRLRFKNRQAGRKPSKVQTVKNASHSISVLFANTKQYKLESGNKDNLAVLAPKNLELTVFRLWDKMQEPVGLVASIVSLLNIEKTFPAPKAMDRRFVQKLHDGFFVGKQVAVARMKFSAGLRRKPNSLVAVQNPTLSFPIFSVSFAFLSKLRLNWKTAREASQRVQYVHTKATSFCRIEWSRVGSGEEDFISGLEWIWSGFGFGMMNKVGRGHEEGTLLTFIDMYY